PAMQNMEANLAIRNINSSRRDINRFLPKNTLPSNISLPNRIHASGNIRGNSSRMNTDLSVNTDLGDASITGSFSEFDNPSRMGYNAKVETRSLQLGTILQNQEMLGPVSATVTINGAGTDPKTANAIFNGTVHSAVLNSYTYHDLTL